MGHTEFLTSSYINIVFGRYSQSSSIRHNDELSGKSLNFIHQFRMISKSVNPTIQNPISKSHPKKVVVICCNPMPNPPSFSDALKDPRFALHRAVRTAQQITTSSSGFGDRSSQWVEIAQQLWRYPAWSTFTKNHGKWMKMAHV